MKKLKRIPFKVAYKIREFLRRNFYMKLTYKFPHYSPHVDHGLLVAILFLQHIQQVDSFI